MKKILLSTVISVCLAFIFLPQSAYAAGFVQDTAGVKYQNDDGSFLKDSWVQVGQSIYHLDKNGLVQTGWIQVGSLWYLMDRTGFGFHYSRCFRQSLCRRRMDRTGHHGSDRAG